MCLFQASCDLKKVCERINNLECTFFILFFGWKRYVKNLTTLSVPFQCRFQPQKETDCFDEWIRTFYLLFLRSKRYRQFWKMNSVPFSYDILLRKGTAVIKPGFWQGGGMLWAVKVWIP